MGNELIKKEDVLNLLYAVSQDDDEIPKNYGTLLDIIRFVRVMPGITTEHIHELESRDTAKKPSIEGDGYAQMEHLYGIHGSVQTVMNIMKLIMMNMIFVRSVDKELTGVN